MGLIPNPWLLAVVASASFASGWWVNGWRHDARDAERVREANRTQWLRVERQDVKAGNYEKAKIQIREKFVPITETVDRIVTRIEYRDICLDDDGLRVVERALANPGSAASQPAPAVSGPAQPR